MWNLRWQVGGLVNAIPDIGEEDLLGRFVTGSGIHGANLRRACIELSWSDQQHEFARFLLFELCALYEMWCEGTLEELGAKPDILKDLQFPTSTFRGRPSGIAHAIAGLNSIRSSPLSSGIHPTLTKQRKYSLASIEALMTCYRYFKEARNSLIHGSAQAEQKLVGAESEFAKLSASDLSVTEVPTYNKLTPGFPVILDLRGVVGFGDVILRLIATLDAELCQSVSAEKVFLDHWIEKLGRGRITVPQNRSLRTARIKKIVRKSGLPTPTVSSAFEHWLRDRSLIVW